MVSSDPDVRDPNSACVTDGIRIEAAAQYLEHESDPELRRFVYAYRIRITNEGAARARLRSRHWVILDAHHRRKDVEGPGVVGKRPDLAPGDSFEYTSYCPLRTEWGTMEGTYTFERPGGERFEARIARFFLAPGVDNSVVLER